MLKRAGFCIAVGFWVKDGCGVLSAASALPETSRQTSSDFMIGLFFGVRRGSPL